MRPFRYLLRVRYFECDAQGIVFNARYGDWTDLTTTELVRTLDPNLIAVADLFDYRLVTQRTTWRAPARFGDVVEASVWIERVGVTSFQAQTRFVRWPDGELLTEAETTYVLVNGRTGEKKPIPDELRALLLSGAPGQWVDHAGVGGGRVVAVVRRAQQITMPWKNGGGVTHELLREGTGAAGFGLRLSIAEVATDGPFSQFPGVDRTILMLTGAGFRLRRADGVVVTLDQAGVPFVFHGEDAWDCALLGGPVRDFNVMTDRATRRASVVVQPPGLVQARYALALAPGQVGLSDLEPWELVELDGPVYSTIPVVGIYT